MEQKMNKSLGTLYGLSAAIIIVSGCGDSKKTGDMENLSAFFPEQFQETSLVRSSEVRTFKGQSLYEYINGGAEIYHLYDFIDVATASYKTGDKEIILDIYRFETDDNAYGLYTSIKPLGPGNIQLGTEGFSTENSVDFIKGKYVVRVVGFDESDGTKNAVKNLAEKVNELLPGSTEKPPMFALFPLENMVPGSERLLAESFLGQVFLNDVYALDYEIQDNELTLFITEDPGGEKFIKWTETEKSKKDNVDPGDLPFDQGKSLLITSDYYGKIIAGLVGGKLIGMVGYKENHREFLSRWLESLSTSSL